MKERHRRGHEGPSLEKGKVDDYHIDEILEILWTLREEGNTDINIFEEKIGALKADKPVLILVENGLIQIEKDHFSFTHEGEQRAMEIIRRHRLAERLLFDVLEIKGTSMENGACQFEHVLSPEVTDSICTFLGHPHSCPHGRPIPRGKCCDIFRRDIQPLVIPMSDLKVGEKGLITFITPKYLSRIQTLSSLGVIPGTLISLYQKHPSYVMEIGETNIAIDREIAENIYVRRQG